MVDGAQRGCCFAYLQVFHAAEGDRQASCKARQEALVRGLLLCQERSRELFAREQGGLFEGALDEVGGCAVVWAVLSHCIGENDASPAQRISGYMAVWLYGYMVIWLYGIFDSILVYQCIDIVVAQYLASME